MTTRNLEIFAAVAECGSMSAAARKLHISQSAVSQVVVELEKKYDVLLFERYAHTLHLTQIGSMLLSYAKQALLLADETENFLLNVNRRARLRVGASVTVGSSLLCELLDRVREAIPQIDFEVAVSNTHAIEEKLLNYELDIALVEGKVASDDLVAERVAEDHLTLVCGQGHPFFGQKAVRAEALNGQTFLLREAGSGTRAQIENELRRHKVHYVAGWVCNNIDVIKKGVVHNFGISAFSPRLLREELRREQLWAFEAEGLNFERSFTLVYHKDKYQTEGFKKFREVCLELPEVEELLA